MGRLLNDLETLLACFKELGIVPQMDDFAERKRLQKIVCLLKLFGIKLGFEFNWYAHGPYSPDLTRTLFELPTKAPRKIEQLNRSEKEKINTFKNFVGEDLRSADVMELIASLFYLDYLAKKDANASD